MKKGSRYFLMYLALTVLGLDVLIPDPLPFVDESLFSMIAAAAVWYALKGGKQPDSKPALAVEPRRSSKRQRKDYLDLLGRTEKLAARIHKRLARTKLLRDEAKLFSGYPSSFAESRRVYGELSRALSLPDHDPAAIEKTISGLDARLKAATGELERAEIGRAIELARRQQENVGGLIGAREIEDARLHRLHAQLLALESELCRSEIALSSAGEDKRDMAFLEEVLGSIRSVERIFREPARQIGSAPTAGREKTGL